MAQSVKQEMQYKRPGQSGFDYYTIIKDVKRRLWVVISLAISIGLLTYMYTSWTYRPSYTTRATYVVSSRGINNSVFTNLSVAQSMAERFSQILTSSTLRKQVADDLGTAGVPGSISCEIVPETNLLVLSVSAGSPQMSYNILRSVMKNYPILSEYLVDNAIMRVLVPPSAPAQPNNTVQAVPKALKTGLLVAAALIALFAFISYSKDTIRQSSDVERKLDTSYLGSICHEEKNKTFKSKFFKGKTSLLITQQTMSFRYVEMMQKVGRKVQNHMNQHGAKTLLITSYLENEGKSTVAANIALSLGQQGKKVLLMDLDLRKPSQYKIFDLEAEKEHAFGKALRGRPFNAPLIGYLEEGIYTMFNAQEFAQSTEMLTIGNLQIILDYLKEQFDYVIIDTPPIAAAADTEVIADMVDASLLVVREHVAEAKDINDIIDVLNGCKAKPVGCVLNDTHMVMGAGSGGYGYNSEYGYGNKYGGYGKYGYGKDRKSGR